MVAPGSREARYQRLAGQREDELYVARTKFGFTIDEWLALPWWQRRVYLNGLAREIEQQEEAAGGGAARQTGLTGLDAIYGGTMADVAASTPFQTG